MQCLQLAHNGNGQSKADTQYPWSGVVTIWEFLTRDSEQCDDPLRPIMRMRVNFTEYLISSSEQCPLYAGVRIKRVSVERGSILLIGDEDWQSSIGCKETENNKLFHLTGNTNGNTNNRLRPKWTFWWGYPAGASAEERARRVGLRKVLQAENFSINSDMW